MSNPVIDRYKNILEEVHATAEACGRDPKSIHIVVVTKGHEWQEIVPLYEWGVRDFGENRVQEWEEKKALSPADVRWHFIGRLQKNKVNKVIGHVHCIHSVDSLELAQKISSVSLERKLLTRILLQVNTSGEEAKQGNSMDEWYACLSEALKLPGVQIEGLMTMAPLTQDDSLVRSCFSALREFRDKLEREVPNCSLPQLSMGMSHDYKLAIEEGATLLRIGSAIL